jgi:hemolysin activation/secretion protein
MYKIVSIHLVIYLALSISLFFFINDSAQCFASSEIIRQQEQINREQDEQLRKLKQKHENAQDREPSQIEINQSAPTVQRSEAGSCVQIDSIVFVGATLLSESDKAGLSEPFIRRCLNISQINDVLRATTNLYIQRGYVTTRVVVPAQDLGLGKLEIRVIEGEVESIMLNEDSSADRRRIAMAFPSGILGKPLNLHDIEQGMDQLNRLPSGNAQLRIEPGEKVGASRIVVTDQPGKVWRFRVGLDNSGQESTGETKSSASVDTDNLLGLNDMLSLNLSADAKAVLDGSRPGSRNVSGYYTVPFGYWSVTASASLSEYYTHLEGGGARYMSDGRTSTYGLDLTRVLHRSSQSKTTAGISLSVKDIDNYIENERLVAGSYDLSIFSASLGHHRRFLDGALGLSGEFYLGLPLFEADRDRSSDRSVPKHEFRKLSLTGSWMRPFEIAGHPFTFNTQCVAQWSPDTLYNSERLNLGGRYTVRGFQLDSLGGDSGGYVRNEIAMSVLPQARSAWFTSVFNDLQVYAGYDAGFIHRDKEDEYERGVLQGAVLGLRTEGGPLETDLCVSRPLDAPSFMKNRDWEIYWSLNSNF